MRASSRLATAGTGHPSTRRMPGAVGVVLMLALGLGVFFLPLKDWLQQGQAIKTHLESFGLAAPLVFIGGTALLIAIGAPRLVVCSLAGVAFGPWWGLAWSQTGTLLGAYATFLTVRAYGREPILRRYPQLDRYTDRIKRRGLLAVLLIRQLPMNGFHNNLLLGLSPVSHRAFLLGSLLGYLPLGATAVLIGAGVVQTDLTRLVQYTAAGLAAFLLLGFLLKWLVGSARLSAEDVKNQPLPANNGLK